MLVQFIVDTVFDVEVPTCSGEEAKHDDPVGKEDHEDEEGPHRLNQNGRHLCDTFAGFVEECHHESDTGAHDEEDEEEDDSEDGGRNGHAQEGLLVGDVQLQDENLKLALALILPAYVGVCPPKESSCSCGNYKI